MNKVVKGKPGPKRSSKRVEDETELLEVMKARHAGLSWRAICKVFGLRNDDHGMTGRNVYLRAQRRFSNSA